MNILTGRNGGGGGGTKRKRDKVYTTYKLAVNNVLIYF